VDLYQITLVGISMERKGLTEGGNGSLIIKKGAGIMIKMGNKATVMTVHEAPADRSRSGHAVEPPRRAPRRPPADCRQDLELGTPSHRQDLELGTPSRRQDLEPSHRPQSRSRAQPPTAGKIQSWLRRHASSSSSGNIVLAVIHMLVVHVEICK